MFRFFWIGSFTGHDSFSTAQRHHNANNTYGQYTRTTTHHNRLLLGGVRGGRTTHSNGG